MSERTDRELVELARQGDRGAVGELFLRYWRAARAAAFGVTGEFASAEDAAAEAFQHALVGLRSLREPDRFGSWLRTIVVRKARLEQRHRPGATLSDDLSDRAERPDETLQRLEDAALIQEAMRALPDRLREAMALTYLEGYDSEAAARFLDVPAGTLRRRLHEGRKRLQHVVGRILRGGNSRMIEERERQLERLKKLADDGETYRALRESLALRPPPRELIDMLVRPRMPRANGSEPAAGGAHRDLVRETVRRFSTPSPRASDANHPVGAAAAAIRAALPEFEEWRFDAGDAAARYLTFPGEPRDRLRMVLPPGFAEGHPGAFLRATRGLLRLRADGQPQSLYQLLQDSPDERTFGAAKPDMRMSDVIDLTWMVPGPLDLRSVQDLLERLAAAVLPAEPMRFSGYDEPRYRSALQLHAADRSARFACGGVLADWPGRPPGIDAAHVRILLEPWASARSGLAVEFDGVPDIRPSE